jgi:hypothetical protein
LNPRPLGYEQADRRPSPSQPVAHTHAGLSRRHRAVSPCLTTSGSLRGVLVTITVTRAGWGQRCRLTPTVRFSGRTYAQLARIVRALRAVAGRCWLPLVAAVAVTVAVSASRNGRGHAGSGGPGSPPFKCCPTARWRLGPEVTNRPAADVFKSAAPEGFWQKCIRSWARAPRRGPAGNRC